MPESMVTASGNYDCAYGDYGQTEMKINPFVMIESNLFAIAPGVVFRGRFPLAMPVRIAAAVGLPEHEVLVAGDAAAPGNGSEQQ